MLGYYHTLTIGNHANGIPCHQNRNGAEIPTLVAERFLVVRICFFRSLES